MTQMIICGDCELRQTLPVTQTGRAIHCVRCDSKLKQLQVVSQDTLIAWALAALILCITANSMPFLTLEYKGGTTTAFLWTGGHMLWLEKFHFLSVLVLLASVFAPFLHILFIGGLLAALRMGFRGPRVARGIRLVDQIGKWAMPGIYLVGVMVAAVKMSQLASLQAGPGLYALIGMVLIWISITTSLDADTFFEFWEEKI